MRASATGVLFASTAHRHLLRGMQVCKIAGTTPFRSGSLAESIRRRCERLRMPNTFVLLFAILALIALATWFVPGGKYETHLVNGKQSDPASFHYVASARKAWWR